MGPAGSVALGLCSLVLVGCSIEINGGDGAGSSEGSREAEPQVNVEADRVVLERAIRRDLPRQIRQNFQGQAAFVDQITCTSGGGGRFDCLAEVTTTDGEGNLRTLPIPIDGTCDDRSCQWRQAS